MIARRFFITALLLASTCVFAEGPPVQDFRITYRKAQGQTGSDEALKGIQRASELQSDGVMMTHRRTLKNGSHEMRASRTMTRAQAWAHAEKLQHDHPEISRIEPINPEESLVHGRAPHGAGVQP